jgi:coproporphyrinogen III oxidase
MNELNYKKKITERWFADLRDQICKEYEKIEILKSKKVKKFSKKTWKASGTAKGGGVMSILKDGEVFDKVGVNVSTVYGKFSEEFKKKIPGAEKNPNFWATGISIVAHLKNPKIPAMHFNTRFIVTTKSWFGGGMDMTPSLDDKKQKKFFHDGLKKMCSKHHTSYYSIHKKNCDTYFYLPHRNESRGDGGIFFDYLNNKDWNKDFYYIRDVGITFKNLSSEIFKKKLHLKWNKKDKDIQLLKRGRYIEFNLLYDRGTKFGLNTNGNIEAIFMSLPPIAKWN